MTIRLLIADDHQFFRWGLSQALASEDDFQVVGEAKNGPEAVEMAQRLKPDVILMDVQMPGLDGVQATRLIFEEKPNAHVIVLTAYRKDEYIFEAIKVGAQGYLLKGVDEETLIDAVRAVYRGEVLIDAQVAGDVLKEFRRLSEFESHSRTSAAAKEGQPVVEIEKMRQLTDGEMDVLRLVAGGEDNTAIAHRLSLSEKTITNRLSSIYEKLQVNSRIQAALFALRSGWVSLNPDEDHLSDQS